MVYYCLGMSSTLLALASLALAGLYALPLSLALRKANRLAPLEGGLPKVQVLTTPTNLR